ncbi:magnesium transporter [Lysinibacter sp. HNR]|uniref:magnesium transporter n=1 Tax=Lysinibacter sp. HNR TaxID=3031408 RepID=UPI0024357E9C|nr:magnesium transporter [Lysinibacter sp. HNR]WGD37007.1 magnesium transporter [Lysinibacter sp. HNR]
MSIASTTSSIRAAIAERDLDEASGLLLAQSESDTTQILYDLPRDSRAIAFRLLPKEESLRVFESFDSSFQKELVSLLRETEVAEVFESLDPDARVGLMEELPAKVAKRLMMQLSPTERDMTAIILGYPVGSAGRRMTPAYLHLHHNDSVSEALTKVRREQPGSTAIYSIPVLDHGRIVVGAVEVQALLTAQEDELVGSLTEAKVFAVADQDAERAARACLDAKLSAIPIVDTENRLVGVLPLADAAQIIDADHTKDAARAGGTEPLRRPYLHTRVVTLTRSRIVWLLVLAVSAILTVNVLEFFETTLEERVALALFIPLLTGIGGNTGSQAATTVTRALAMGEAHLADVGRVAFKEARTGFLMGSLLGLLGWAVASLIYGPDIGAVIGLTLVAVCTMAASVGGTMPIIAQSLRVDPAVFSTPFISTFCDATGLIIYFNIARAILNL